MNLVHRRKNMSTSYVATNRCVAVLFKELYCTVIFATMPTSQDGYTLKARCRVEVTLRNHDQES